MNEDILVISDCLSLEVQKKVLDAFEIFDHEQNKTVDAREIGTIIRSLGIVQVRLTSRKYSGTWKTLRRWVHKRGQILPSYDQDHSSAEVSLASIYRFVGGISSVGH